MKKKRPNILLIMADQHRIDCVGTYGNREIQTPHIDQLAADGVVYENSFCAAPVCTPSRYSVLTGLYPHQHQGYSNNCAIHSGTATFPRMLREQGYQTKAVGKMHLTPTYLDLGFSEMELAEQNGPGRFEDDYHQYLKDHGLVDQIDLIDQVKEYREQSSLNYWETFGAEESDLPEEHHSTTWIGNKAVAALEDWNGESSNFLMASFIKPHHPFDPPAPWSRMYDPEQLSLLPGWTESCLEQDLAVSTGFFPYESLNKKALRTVMAYYYGMISQIDSYVGQMIEMLKKKNLYDNTVIVYTSDHGEYLGFHHMLLKGNHMYDPLTKVPLVIKYPEQANKGIRSDALVSNIDLAPTLLKQAHCSPEPSMAGKDLSDPHFSRKYVFTEQGRGTAYMIRSHDYKLLLHHNDENSAFFDLQKDPLEMNNIIDDPTYLGVIEEHKNALYRMMLFDAIPPIHLEMNVPTTKALDSDLDVKEWVREKMGKVKHSFLK